MKLLFPLALLSMILTACDKSPPAEPVVVTRQLKVNMPIECVVDGQSWVELRSDGSVRASDVARNYQINKQRFRRLSHYRSICRAAIVTDKNVTVGQQ